MEQAGTRGTHGSPGPAGPDAAAAPFRVPAQPRAAEPRPAEPRTAEPRPPEPGAPGPARPGGGVAPAAAGDGTGAGAHGAPTASARGEHTHSEPPAPRTHREPPVPHLPREAPVPQTHREAPTPYARDAGSPPAVPAQGTRPVVRRASVRGQILDALRTALVAGELAPGEVYSAPALGERFGVSATPVREAMQQLALEGAVEVVPNRGFRVIERGTRELAELAEIRGLIEVPVMLRLARTVPAARWAELRPLAEATVRAASSGCRATYAETDRSFHRAVLTLAGNAQLVRIADDLHRRAQWPLVGGPVSRGRADLVADAAEHTALLDALIAGDLAVVQSLVREHFTGAP
ncbi:GntR family transcriptional regulator [Streptomyces sp. NPDC007084]|uniref:GntR family transcriptional regulator n=1 Tax=Streptomyces sp. NPDC007084 TaxID=3154313 RepID=UPI00345162B9